VLETFKSVKTLRQVFYDHNTFFSLKDRKRSMSKKNRPERVVALEKQPQREIRVVAVKKKTTTKKKEPIVMLFITEHHTLTVGEPRSCSVTSLYVSRACLS
jgi:hypothetical protein